MTIWKGVTGTNPCCSPAAALNLDDLSRQEALPSITGPELVTLAFFLSLSAKGKRRKGTLGDVVSINQLCPPISAAGASAREQRSLVT